MIDLHTHSTASDGSLTPTELIQRASKVGLQAIALTDHDTVAGIEEFLNAPADTALLRVPGVEISTAWYSHSIHILGLFIDPTNYPLRELLSGIRFSRCQRARLMVKRLASCGIEITYEALEAIAAPAAPGRAHLAKLLVEMDVCQAHQEVFERYLGRGRPAYASMDLPALGNVIRAIHAADGVAIWAHPTGLNRQSTRKVRKTCKKMMAEGLDGLEAYYSQYTADQEQNTLRLAAELNLIVSGGSDFHGDLTPGVELGSGKGNLSIPMEIFKKLQERHRNISQENLRRGNS